MELPAATVALFEASRQHGDNTDVLLALLTQNKELEGGDGLMAASMATFGPATIS